MKNLKTFLAVALFTAATATFAQVQKIDQLRVTTNVGIGVPSPTFPLEISGVSGLAKFTGSSTDVTILLNNNFASAENWAITNGQGSAGGTGLFFYNQTDGFSRLVLANDGNVGIGTTSPGQKLTVNGNIKFGDNTNTAKSGSLRFWGGDGGTSDWNNFNNTYFGGQAKLLALWDENGNIVGETVDDSTVVATSDPDVKFFIAVP